MITFFSVLMAGASAALMAGALFFIRRKYFALCRFHVKGILFLSILCGLRICFPLEFSFTKVVPAPVLLNWFVPFLYHPFGVFALSPMQMLMAVWGIVGMILLLRLTGQYIQTFRWLKNIPAVTNTTAEKMLDMLCGNRRRKGCLICSPAFEVPMQTGLLRPVILLPAKEYSTEELGYILQHELTHFDSYDTRVKLAANIVRCCFWWNPLVYFLVRELDESLELNCDFTVTRPMPAHEKAAYLSALLEIYQGYQGRDNTCDKNLSAQSAFFCKKHDNKMILRRFRFVKSARPSGWMSVLCVIVSFVFFLMSYMVILQPSGSPKLEGDGCIYYSPQDTVIYQYPDGTYRVYLNGELAENTNAVLAEHMIQSGYKVLEVN